MTASVIYAESIIVRPAPPLTSYVASYVGYRYEGFPPGMHLGLPSRHLTVIICLTGTVRVTEMPDPAQSPGEFATLERPRYPAGGPGP